MVDQIKQLRVKIDGLAQLTGQLKPIPMYPDVYIVGEEPWYYIPSNEINKSYDSLILAKAWLGKVLSELGTESPYKSGYKDVKDIEPTADVQEWIYYNDGFKDKAHIEKVDWLRTEIQSIIDNTEDFSKNYDYIKLEQGFVYKYLCEAKFWLGFELQKIKEESNK